MYYLIWPILGCAAGQGMVFVLSVLNRVYTGNKILCKSVLIMKRVLPAQLI